MTAANRWRPSTVTTRGMNQVVKDRLEHRDMHVVEVVRGDAAAICHGNPARRRHPDVPDPLPVDDVHDPEPGGVRPSPRSHVVAPLHPGAGWHHAAGTQHEVARPAERMLTRAAWPVAGDDGERAKSPIDLVAHLAHAGSDVVAAYLRRLRPEPSHQALDPPPLAHQRGDQPPQLGNLDPGGLLGAVLGHHEPPQPLLPGAPQPGEVLDGRGPVEHPPRIARLAAASYMGGGL